MHVGVRSYRTDAGTLDSEVAMDCCVCVCLCVCMTTGKKKCIFTTSNVAHECAVYTMHGSIASNSRNVEQIYARLNTIEPCTSFYPCCIAGVFCIHCMCMYFTVVYAWCDVHRAIIFNSQDRHVYICLTMRTYFCFIDSITRLYIALM